MAKPKRGPTALDLLALGGIAALVVVLVLPRLSGLRMDHNERDAVHALSVLHARLRDLRNDRASGVDPASRTPLSRLIAPGAEGRTPLDDCAIEKHAEGREVLRRHGYVFRVDYEESDAAANDALPFTIYAVPEAYGETGSLAFAVTHERELKRARNLSRRYDGTNPPPPGAAVPLRLDVPETPPRGSYEAKDGTPWEGIDWPSDL